MEKTNSIQFLRQIHPNFSTVLSSLMDNRSMSKLRLGYCFLAFPNGVVDTNDLKIVNKISSPNNYFSHVSCRMIAVVCDL